MEKRTKEFWRTRRREKGKKRATAIPRSRPSKLLLLLHKLQTRRRVRRLGLMGLEIRAGKAGACI